MKKFIRIFLPFLLVMVLLFSLTACDLFPDIDSENNNNLIELKGDTGAKGDKGDTGAKGENGITPHIGENGNWFVGEIDTGIKAQGQKGDTGENGAKGEKGEKGATGDKGDTGANGITPHIGANGNWFIGTVDTGIKAQGVKGDTGEKGEKGDTGLSAYEIYIKYNPDYLGDEAQWLDCLVNGRLAENYQSIFAFTPIAGTKNCVVSLADKTVTEVIIPKTAVMKGVVYTVTEIAVQGFATSPYLHTVILPETVKKIGASAFQTCPKLKTVYMPAVEEIGANAFSATPRIEHIYLPDTVQTVGATIFRTSDTTYYPKSKYPLTVHIAGSLNDTANWAVNWSSYYEGIKIDYNSAYTDNADLLYTLSADGKGCYVGGANTDITSLHLPPIIDGLWVKGIMTYGFAYFEITEAILPATVQFVAMGAFMGCLALETIYLAEVKYIGENAFSFCDNLNNITIPLSVKYIGADAFYYSAPININVELPYSETLKWAEDWSSSETEDITIIYDYKNI